MAATGITRRSLLINAGLIGGGAVVLNACTGGAGAGGSDSTPDAGAPIQGVQVITDPSAFPKKLHESPEFAAQVAERKLDPVAQRIGQDPLVIKPVTGIGKYGGVMRLGFITDDTLPGQFCCGPDNLLYWDYKHEKIVPNLARAYDVSRNQKEMTLHLRRGMRWSDGHPFTADDIIFWREDINLNPTIGFPSTVLAVNGKQVSVEKVDDHTVVFRSPEPYGALPEFFAGNSDVGSYYYNGAFGGGGFAPKHYLKQFHPKYTSESEATKRAKKAGFSNWAEYLLNQADVTLNPDLPTIMPWKLTRPYNKPPWEFDANPYSIWVDTAGNQLPYVPKVSLTNTDDLQVFALNQVSGDYDYADRGLQVSSLPLLIKNQSRSDYTLHKTPDGIMDCAIIINLAYEGEIGDLLRTTDFRRALSLGIDRHQVNETYFLGTGTPSATMCAASNYYYPGKEWTTKWATHDPEQANAMLDKLGLKRGSDGIRRTKSGQPIRMEMQSTASKADFPTMGEMIRRQWKQIGIDATSDLVDGDLLTERVDANKVMMTVNNNYGVEEPFLNPIGMIPYSTAGVSATMGYPYIQWFLSNGKQGQEPPPSVGMLKDAVALYQRASLLPRNQRQNPGKQLLQMHADQVWTIGVVGQSLTIYGIYCSNNKLGNVAKNILNDDQMGNTEILLPQTFYYT